MNTFKFIVYLGVINIIFSFVWKWIFGWPAAILLVALKIDNYGKYVVRIFGAYLLVSLTAILTRAAFHNSPNMITLILYPLIGAFVIFLGHAQNIHEMQKETPFDIVNLKFEIILMFSAIAFYILAFIVPSVAINSLTKMLYTAIGWVLNLPTIGWLVGAGGVLFLIAVFIYGLIVIGLSISMVIGKIRGQPG